MVVTGVYLSSEVVGSVDAAISTIYGRTLLLKVALAAVAGALALVNTVRLRRRQPALHPPPHRPGRGDRRRGRARPGGGPHQRPAGDGAAAGAEHRPGHGRARGPQGGRPAGDRVDPPQPARAQHRPGRRVRHTSTGPLAGAGGGRVAEPAGRSERGARCGPSRSATVAGRSAPPWRRRVPSPCTSPCSAAACPTPPPRTGGPWAAHRTQTRPAVVSTAPLGPGLRVAAAVLLLALLGAGLLALAVRLLGRRTPGPRSPDRPVPVTSPEPVRVQAERRPDPVRL